MALTTYPLALLSIVNIIIIMYASRHHNHIVVDDSKPQNLARKVERVLLY